MDQILGKTKSDPEYRPLRTRWLKSARNIQGLYNKNAVLHEYLHFLQLDNAPRSNHNAVNAQGRHVDADDDLVYSCAEIVFPYWSTRTQKTAIGYFDISKACYLCAMVASSNGEPRVDELRAEAADGVCRDYRRFEALSYAASHR
jgi:hypothetical protein